VIPTVGAEFVCCMEDVLDLYAEAYDPARPTVCFDETSKQLIAETRVPLPLEPGKPERVDYEYERRGTVNLFLVTEPHTGWRHVDVTDRRTKHDFAHQMRDLVDRHFPNATKIRVVLDNLNTHTRAALYEAFPPTEARRVLRKLEFHYTPVHGSWLNMAEARPSQYRDAAQW
jgi:DDE superfamily endonuclease